jgi:hypothetical protein
MADPIGYMSPEAVQNFKSSMRAGEINSSNKTMQSFRRMFPNWDMMTEEQKRKAMNDPERLGKMDAQQSREQMDMASLRSKAFRDELKRSR